MPEVPAAILTHIAAQVGVKVNAFDQYGLRENTLYEHLDQIRREFGFRTCTWTILRRLGRSLLPLALESDRAVPLIEAALERLRTDKVIAPGMSLSEISGSWALSMRPCPPSSPEMGEAVICVVRMGRLAAFALTLIILAR